MAFETNFKQKNKKIATSSVRTYLANIRRLARALGHDKIPESPAWLKKAPAWLNKQTLNIKKILSAAGVKAAQTYGITHEALSKIVKKAGEEYDAFRKKGKKTKREAALMPKDGYKSIAKAAARLRADLPKTTKTLRDYMRVQDAWLLSFFAKHTPRLINDVLIGKGKNKLVQKGKTFTLVLGQHKTSKTMGTSKIKLDKSLYELTNRMIKGRPPVVDHNYLLVAPRGGKMSKSQLSARLRKITGKALGRGFSTQILRVLKATDKSAEMKKVRQYLAEMGHSLTQEAKYVAN
jgi:hypothetical protein